MKLDDFLKVKKVRCVVGDATITTGKVYDVIGVDETFIHLIDDNGGEAHYWYCRFEPVLDDMSKSAPETDTSANSVDLTNLSFKTPVMRYGELEKAQTAIESSVSAANTELHPEFEALDKPRFKVGDRVYNTFDVKIRIIDEINDDVVSFKDGGSCVARICVHATPENHALLSQLYPHIEFEQPPKELTGSDLARAMLESGYRYIVADCGDCDDWDVQVIYLYKDGYFYNTDGNGYLDIKPIDPRTGLPLTQAVLDE